MNTVQLQPELAAKKQTYQEKILAFFERSEFTRSLKGFDRELKAVGVFSLVANLLMLTPTLYMLQVYDRVMVSQSTLTLIALSMVAIFLFGMMSFSEWIRSRVLVRAGIKLDAILGPKVFNAAFESSLRGSHATPQKALSDLTQLRQFVTGNGIFAVFDAPWSPIYIIVLFMLSPWLGLLALVFAALFVSLALISQSVSQVPQTKAIESAQHDTTFANSKLRNAEIIESLGMLPSLRRRWLGRHHYYLRTNEVAQDINHRLTSASKFFRYCQQSLVLGAGALLVIDGQLTPGAMIAANVLMGRALQPIDMIVASWRGFFTANKAFVDLEALLEKYPERKGLLTPTDSVGDIKLDNLTATAPGRQQPILKSLNVHFPAGSVTAIVGPSGSGKSTMARCLMGIWPETQGTTLLDGEPIQRWDRFALGPYIGYLPQDIELFEGTIAENIARFGPIVPEKVIEATTKAGMHEMILRFSKGYDTPMGEAGGTLSGGQKQRLGLARALYGNPSLVVLDEPNANLDAEGEAALAQAIQGLKVAGKTVFLITHRPQIINVVDQILVLVDGQIKHFGPRDDVIRALQAPATN
ncbi:MAG: hypothetical protein RIR18_2236 [Pseudomonadota bacterium]